MASCRLNRVLLGSINKVVPTLTLHISCNFVLSLVRVAVIVRSLKECYKNIVRHTESKLGEEMGGPLTVEGSFYRGWTPFSHGCACDGGDLGGWALHTLGQILSQ